RCCPFRAKCSALSRWELGNAIVLLYICEASVLSRDGEFRAIEPQISDSPTTGQDCLDSLF
ncbi:hypothetical protein, partial [Microcoleus sp. Pol12A5]|uniref:hypothetical protein n=1 Tax=Microcoleus sp. Pol12A5 TaxID=3055392 RepID=UPI002FCF27D6